MLDLWLFVEDSIRLRSRERVVIWDIRSFGLDWFNLLSEKARTYQYVSLIVCSGICIYIHVWAIDTDVGLSIVLQKTYLIDTLNLPLHVTSIASVLFSQPVSFM